MVRMIVCMTVHVRVFNDSGDSGFSRTQWQAFTKPGAQTTGRELARTKAEEVELWKWARGLIYNKEKHFLSRLPAKDILLNLRRMPMGSQLCGYVWSAGSCTPGTEANSCNAGFARETNTSTTKRGCRGRDSNKRLSSQTVNLRTFMQCE